MTKGNEIRDDGASVLASIVENHPTLRILNLQDNEIGNEGATAFAEMIEKNHTLNDLNLGCT